MAQTIPFDGTEECGKCGCRWGMYYSDGKVIEGKESCPRCNDMLCAKCGGYLPSRSVHCSCHKYGNGSHEELQWCSDKCMDNDHPDYDQPEEEE